MLHPAAIGNTPAFPLPHPHIIGFGNIFPFYLVSDCGNKLQIIIIQFFELIN